MVIFNVKNSLKYTKNNINVFQFLNVLGDFKNLFFRISRTSFFFFKTFFFFFMYLIVGGFHRQPHESTYGSSNKKANVGSSVVKSFIDFGSLSFVNFITGFV